MGINSAPGQGNTSEGKKDYQSMTFSELEADSIAGPILQSHALEYLRLVDTEYFENNFTGEVDESGYLIRKDGQKPNTKPSQNIGGGNAMLGVTQITKADLEARER